MNNNMNSNGHDPDNKNIIRFPNESERKKSIKQQEKQLQQQYKQQRAAAKKAGSEPFLNIAHIPTFARILVATILIIHIPLHLFIAPEMRTYIIYTLGFTPAAFTSAPEAFEWNALITPLTHIFLHGNWMHLLFNTAMGLALTMFFERIYGTRAAIKFFFLSCLGGILFYFAISPFSTSPVIGASGGISGFFGAVLFTTLMQIKNQPSYYSTASIMDGRQRLRQKASEIMRDKGPWPILFLWGVIMTFFGLLSGDNIAWSVHLGGYATGIALITLMQKGKLRL